MDLDGPWGWRQISSADVCEIFSKLGNFESMSHGALFGPGGAGKTYELAGLAAVNRDATRRISELELDDEDELHRLRLTGERRLYGLLRGRDFYVLWWDPNHQVWPSPLKHT